MASENFEAGILPGRTEFVRETTPGVTPADPSWVLFSDLVRTFEPVINPQTVARDALGNPDTEESHPSTEASEATIAYDLQQWLVDGSGNALDAAYDAIARTTDNRLPNTHTVVRRTEQNGLLAANTLNGSTSRDTRQYFVGRGGHWNELTLALEPSDTPAWQVEGTYLFERAERQQIDQPTDGESPTELTVKSTDTADTSQTVTIEDEGASTTEDVPLDGTNLQSTSGTFSDVDVVVVDADTVGDVVVAINTGSSTTPTEGDELARLKGTDAFAHDLGQLGVPALGSGSHASAIGTAYQLAYDGDTIERPSGTAIAANIGTHELTVTNNVEPGSRATTPTPSLAAGKRELELAATVWGETERYQQVLELVTAAGNDYVWTPASGDTLTLGNTKVTAVEASEEAQQGRMEIDVTVAQQESVTIA